MGWETHGSLQARRSHIRRAGAAHDERRSREHEHHGRQKAPAERGGDRTPSPREGRGHAGLGDATEVCKHAARTSRVRTQRGQGRRTCVG